MNCRFGHARSAKYVKFCSDVAALAGSGVGRDAIAERLGVSRFAVDEALRTPSQRQRRTVQTIIAAHEPEPCKVPRWVPDNLVGTYQDLAAEHGEEHAASVVRRLKAEARP